MSKAAQMKKRKNKFRKFAEKRNHKCGRHQEETEESKEAYQLIDYKFLEPLQAVITGQGKLHSRKRSGNCNRCQKLTKIAIKRARFMGLMPYVG